MARPGGVRRRCGRATGGHACSPSLTVTKDATRTAGPLTVWQKDDKLWLELQPKDFGQPYFFSPKLASGIGEAACTAA